MFSLAMDLGYGLEVGFGLGGLGGVAHGPTVQIARSPSSVSAANGATGTLTQTPEDSSGASTGAASYWKSSDPTKLRIDNAATGAWTWLGSLGDTAYAYADPNVPNAEPAYTGAVTQDRIYHSDFSEYAGMSMADMQALNGGISTTGPIRFYPVNLEPLVQRITRPDGTGVGFSLRGIHNMPGDTYTSGGMQLVPSANDLGNPGRGPVFNRLARHFIQHRLMMTTDVVPVTTPQRFKHVELWHQDAAGRLQFDTTNVGPSGTSHLTHFQPLDISKIHPDAVGGGAFGSGSQVLGPWVNTDIANSGVMYRCTYEVQPSTFCPGTVTLLLQGGTFFFGSNLTSAGCVAGDRIKITAMAKDGGGTSTADFQLVSGSGTLWTVTRKPDISTNKGTFAITGIYGADVSQTALFSTSRAGVLTTGAHGGWVTASNGNYYEVSGFDGTTGCTLSRTVGDSNDITGDIACQYNDTQDGWVRMWVAPDTAPVGTGTLIINISKATVGQTPAGGESVWCQLGDVAAAVPLNDGIQWMQFFGPLSQGESMTWNLFGPFDWWVTGGRGSYP